MVRIEAITFDLWDTLIQEVPGGSAAVARLRLDEIEALLATSGSGVRREDLEAAYRRTGEHLENVWNRAEDISLEEQIGFFLDNLQDNLSEGIGPVTLAEVTKVYSESMLKHGPVLLPGADRALAAVGEHCSHTGLISNTGKTPGSVLRTLLSSMGILDRFDVTVFSNEVRARKPDRRIFDYALKELGVDAERTVHIGDNPWADVDGAKAIGMMAIQVGPATATGDHRPDEYARSLDEVAPAILRLKQL